MDTLSVSVFISLPGIDNIFNIQRMRWLDGITDSMDTEPEQAPGDGEGQGSLACCSSWGHKGSDMTE